MADLTDKATLKEQMIKYGFTSPDMTVTEFVEDCLPSAQPDLSGYSDRLWKAAYERGKAEAEQRWIAVEYRPTEFGKEVLISHKGVVSIDWLTQSEGWAYFFVSGAAIADIDAWMPLPTAYERSEE